MDRRGRCRLDGRGRSVPGRSPPAAVARPTRPFAARPTSAAAGRAARPTACAVDRRSPAASTSRAGDRCLADVTDGLPPVSQCAGNTLGRTPGAAVWATSPARWSSIRVLVVRESAAGGAGRYAAVERAGSSSPSDVRSTRARRHQSDLSVPQVRPWARHPRDSTSPRLVARSPGPPRRCLGQHGLPDGARHRQPYARHCIARLRRTRDPGGHAPRWPPDRRRSSTARSCSRPVLGLCPQEACHRGLDRRRRGRDHQRSVPRLDRSPGMAPVVWHGAGGGGQDRAA